MSGRISALVLTLGALGLMIATLTARIMLTRDPLPLGTARYAAPPEYAEWWKRLEDCIGAHGDLGRIRWFSVNAIAHKRCLNCFVGYWRQRGDSSDIYIVRPGYGAPLSRTVVEHEMLHELLFQAGVTGADGGHPHPPFGRCTAF